MLRLGQITPHHAPIADTHRLEHVPVMSPMAKLVIDVGSVFTPYSRPLSADAEMRAAFPAVQRHLRHSTQGEHRLAQLSYPTLAGVTRAFAQVCSPKSATAADVWSTGETMLGGELGSAVRGLISTVPLPMPAKLGMFVASYGVDTLQAGYERDPEKVSHHIFSTGSDFGDPTSFA